MPDTAVSRGYVMGFDFGLRRIGVAVGQPATCTASGLETVSNGQKPDWAAIERLVAEWRPSLLLVGLPLSAGGEETEMSKTTRKFGSALEQRFSLPVAYADERLSSRAAESHFAELRSKGGLRRKHARHLDAMAARIIVENWLQEQDGPGTPAGLCR